MRALRPRLAHRLARGAAPRYKIAGGVASFALYAVVVPTTSLLLDPGSERPAVFVGVTLSSSALLVWGYFAATGLLARSRVLG